MKFSAKVKKEYSSTFNSTFPYAFIACIKTILWWSSIVIKIITPPPPKKKIICYLSNPLPSHELHCILRIADCLMYLSWSNFICCCIWVNRDCHIKCGEGLIEIKWNVIWHFSSLTAVYILLICLSVCVCVCARARARVRERENMLVQKNCCRQKMCWITLLQKIVHKCQ